MTSSLDLVDYLEIIVEVGSNFLVVNNTIKISTQLRRFLLC